MTPNTIAAMALYTIYNYYTQLLYNNIGVQYMGWRATISSSLHHSTERRMQAAAVIAIFH